MTSIDTPTSAVAAPRRGVATLTRLAYAGAEPIPLYAGLTRACRFEAEQAGDVMDLALLSQLLGDGTVGLRLQSRILDVQRLYRLAETPAAPRLRLLCLAAEMDIGGNTPVEFLVDNSDVELFTLYLRDGETLPADLPDHDVLMIIMPDDVRCARLLKSLTATLKYWPRRVLNRPEAISNLDRDRLCSVLQDAPGLTVPPTMRVGRVDSQKAWNHFGAAPLVVRPVGSHAGKGLALVHTQAELQGYLDQYTDDKFFVSPFIDYRSADGLFRKYRVVLVDGVAYPVHMAIGPIWSLWYLNAEMERTPARRAEEMAFMEGFAADFAKRHHDALCAVAHLTGLDYVGLDCAETPDGRLLVFEADNTIIVHDMDPPALFPYKTAHLQRLFKAFQDMLFRSLEH